MKKNIVSLTKQLIRIKSTQGNPEMLGKALNLALSQLSGFTVEHFEKNGVKSVLVYNAAKRPAKFKIILNGHLDVVPGKENRYKPVMEGNKLYGVGALDMKASVSCLLKVFGEVAKKVSYPLALQLVTDEEVGGYNGTQYQVEKGVSADFVIAAEPTNLNIVDKAKGILNVKITATGKTAHGAYPWRGVNAIWEMYAFLTTLKKEFPVPTREEWVTTVNLSKIETSNTSLNKIPDDCSVLLDIRFIPENSDSILQKIKSLVPDTFTVQVLAHEPALLVSEANEYIQNLKQISEKITGDQVILYGANGSSDARHYTKIGTDGIEFGPIGGNIGADDEWVD
ncbi:MAG TPA: M20/M25/M40 family metallo-hydrolase, partial [Cyclobacteriaceae bacterium]|nr:M20/M25/M40 family metallo-hydrolase [Cyclobacteriaceae bacterium]